MENEELFQKYLYIIIILFNCIGSLFMLILIIDSFLFAHEIDKICKHKVIEPFQSKLLLDELDEPVEWFDENYRLYGFN